jgi:transposase
MEMIGMNNKERRRMSLMTRVMEGLLRLREAAEMLRVSYRQAKRIWRRYRQDGDKGLVHLGRGRQSNRARAATQRKQSVALYRKRYSDFGPLLACEHLSAEHGIVVDHETLRRWLMDEGLWQVRRRREAHRAARERRPRRGDLVQIDGSEHDWFEGRGPRAVMMVMIDDATNTTMARFYLAEDTASAYDIFDRYVGLYGLPAALYPDRDSIYFCTREACLDEELATLGPETQFARAMRELGVDMFPAHSPQAKGRVERRHGLFQDRLVKELRLLGVRTIDAANAFLDGKFMAFVNERYTVMARDPANGHLPCPSEERLAMTLSWQESRCVAKDWTLCWRTRRLQIDARHAALGLPGRRVTVVQRRDTTIAIRYEHHLLTFRDAPPPAMPAPRPTAPRTIQTPAPDHPWRRSFITRRPIFRPPPTSFMAHSRGAENRATSVPKCTAPVT